jgi:hypothetical protein
MKTILRPHVLAALGWFLPCWAALATGCAREQPDSRYTPAPEAARQALEAALRSWQEGRPPGRIEGTANPEVVFVDNCRSREQSLQSFTILGETPGESQRCFAVRLRLANPEEEQRVRFVVFGIDLLWVYRHEDFEMMIHWQCGLAERDRKTANSKAEGTSADVHP